MRTIKNFLTMSIFILVFCFAIISNPAKADTLSNYNNYVFATIQTDKTSYAPGDKMYQTVSLTRNPSANNINGLQACILSMGQLKITSSDPHPSYAYDNSKTCNNSTFGLKYWNYFSGSTLFFNIEPSTILDSRMSTSAIASFLKSNPNPQTVSAFILLMGDPNPTNNELSLINTYMIVASNTDSSVKAPSIFVK